MSAATADRLRPLVTPVVSAVGLDLEGVEVIPAGRRRLVRIAVDKDGGVSLDDVALVSRALSDLLDQADVMGAQPYVLEVGSPGVDRPLTQARHWRRATGRLVDVELVTGGRLTGRIEATDAEGVDLDVDGHDRRVEYSGVRTARVQVEFTHREGPSDRVDDTTTGDEEG